jgi:hypothetical protein
MLAAAVLMLSGGVNAQDHRLQPSDLIYKGAFTFPLGDPWAYSGHALAFYPSGDSSGPDDGFPGSLYASGHTWDDLVGEISIPEPVISSNFNELPEALMLKSLQDITGGWIANCTYTGDCEYREVDGLVYLDNVEKIAWNLRDWYNVAAYDQASLGWSDLDMSGAQGVWHIGVRDGDVFHNARTCDYLFTAPEDFAVQHLDGKWLIAGNHREAGALGGSQGPTLYALAPWEESSLPPDGGEVEAIPLLYYPENYDCTYNQYDQCAFPGYRVADDWGGGAWVEAAAGKAVLIFGRKGLGSNCYGTGEECGDTCETTKGWHSAPYQAQVLFYDPQELKEVAEGNLNPWDVVPYTTLSLETEVLNPGCAELGAVAFDRTNGLIYVTEEVAGPWGETVVHVWQVSGLQVSGTVTDESQSAALPGVVMDGLPYNPSTDTSGFYSAEVESGWSGTVTPVKSGYAFTPTERTYAGMTENQADQDYTASPSSFFIMGGVFDMSDTPVSGVYMNGLPGTPKTGADGSYAGTVSDGWSGTVCPAKGGFVFSPVSLDYTNVSGDQSGQDYSAASDTTIYEIRGEVIENGSELEGVYMQGFPQEGIRTGTSGRYLGTAVLAWSGTVTPVLPGYSFSPESRTYAGINSDFAGQDYTSSSLSGPSDYQVIPEVLWAPAYGGGNWVTEVQITDITGGSEVSVFYNTSTGERRGPVVLFTGEAANTSVKTGNLLSTLDQLDSGFSYYGKVGAVEFITQDAAHRIHVTARTRRGSYSKTFAALNNIPDNTVGESRVMMIQNLVSNDMYRTAYGGFNPTDETITVEYELKDNTGSTVGSIFTKSFTGRQYQAFNVFSEAGVPYPDFSFDNIWLKISHVSGAGELMSYGATADNTTNDPAVHPASQSVDDGEYNSPADYQVIPEVLWAPAEGGGTWKTEVQITDVTGGSEVSAYFNSVTGQRRGPFLLFNGGGEGTSGKTGNLLHVLDQLDPGFDYYGTAGAVEFMTQDSEHQIHVSARTSNGRYSKSFQGINQNGANTAGGGRVMAVQNLVSNEDYRSSCGLFNPTDNFVTVELSLIDSDGAVIGVPFNKTLSGHQFQALYPFTEAGMPYPAENYNNVWLKVEVTDGNGEVMVYGATADNLTNDPAVHKAVRY